MSVAVSSNSAPLVIESRSSRETKMWGRRLGAILSGGELIGFTGDLGVGKTCFIKGLARGLDLAETRILSPTFTMIQEHQGRLPLFHIDLYRLESVALDDLGLREYLFSDGVAAVEWFERLREANELDHLSIRITYAEANSRRIEFAAIGPRYAALVEQLSLR
ncbi:MAG TPA: tRNA (adenosine(37)-N6)-threonylcarbamoyltransferase complex ATPase subunit type 1 TsaE [Candidatus Binataceae bacterium]|jgi:tRNA threonylcarbamoyladenosine biosynthesis protein TsaE|nr:tRNA (adenosine(37)-N6)-threonylcarbamoyltransferase complex ATPase subunit type 1 TsaE [Candidatus Binataceae bacterium]